MIVIGAGAAGMMAACAAADRGHQVTVLEKNEKAGKKIYITGKGRCNLTNDCDTADFFDHVPENPKFLYSSVYSFDHEAVKAFFESNGCPVKTERGKRVFPVSDRACDVTDALMRQLRRKRVWIRFHKKVEELLMQEASSEDACGQKRKLCGVRLSGGGTLGADRVIVCTGGLSYPSTGSTGDGYRFAESAGHTVVPCAPSLVPFETAERWPLSLQGLSLRNVALTISPAEQENRKTRPVYSGFGELLFTHFGISGPLILTASAYCDFRRFPQGFRLCLDLKPAIPEEELYARVEALLAAAPERQFGSATAELFPQRLRDVMTELSGIARTRRAGSVQPGEIRSFVRLMKAVPLTAVRTRSYAEAVVTRGGVCVREVNPSTMESRLVSGLYFAGEVLDVDAVTGGFNLQIAWSTGHLAGESV